MSKENDIIQNINIAAFDEFNDMVKKKRVLTRHQLKSSCVNYLKSINLEINIKSLFFGILDYWMRNENKAFFQVPVENIFYQKEIDLDKLYQNFINNKSIIIQLEAYFLDQSSQCITNLREYFWFVTFPNLFGSFLSLESNLDAQYFIENLFFTTFNDKSCKGQPLYFMSTSLAVISFISHNYLFLQALENSFFQEITFGLYENQGFPDNQKESFEKIYDLKNQLSALKNALKSAALTLNQCQIHILHRYFATPSDILKSKIPFQYKEIINKLIIPVIKKWEFSPYFQGSKILSKKEEGKGAVQGELRQILQTYASNDSDEILKIIQPFVDVVNEYYDNYQKDYNFFMASHNFVSTNNNGVHDTDIVDDLVNFSNLLFSNNISKVLTNLDIFILSEIEKRINPNDDNINQSNDFQQITQERGDLMFFYQVIECSPNSVTASKLATSVFMVGNNDEDNITNDIFISEKIDDDLIAQWLQMKEQLKYGSDYADIISSKLDSTNVIVDTPRTLNDEIRRFNDLFGKFIQMGKIEVDQDIKMRDFILDNLQNFDKTIYSKLRTTNNILIMTISSLIRKLKINEEAITSSFVSTLKDFYKKYLNSKKKVVLDDNEEEEENNENNNEEFCVELTNDSEFNFLKLLINGKYEEVDNKKNANNSKKEEEDLLQLQYDQFSSTIESGGIFYSFVIHRGKDYNEEINIDDDNDQLKRSIKFLYKLYIDYVKRGLLLSNKNYNVIRLMKDKDFMDDYQGNVKNLFYDEKRSVYQKNESDIILQKTLPYLSYLLKPMVFDIEEKERKIAVCLASFENAAYLINQLLAQICILEGNKQIFAAYAVRSVIGYIVKGRRVEDSEFDSELLSIFKAKSMTFYKFLANQKACQNYPELQKLRTFFL